MRVLIACAGPDLKWRNYLGLPRHLVSFDGQPLLRRTVAQALEISDDVHVISGPDERYNLPGTTWHVHTEATPNEFITTRQWWSQTGRTVLLLGDTYYTDHAIDVIASYERKLWQLFGREHASKVTGTPWGEYFTCSWWPQHQQMMLEHLDQVIVAWSVGIAKRCTGWELLRSIQRTPLNEHTVNRTWFTEIDDLTDDFDFPVDYDRHPRATPEVAGV